MPKTMRHLFVIISLTLLALIPLGCSDDDPSDPGGGDPVDTTSPLVVDINPGYRSTGVALDAVVRVEFSEPMDPASAAGSITLDQGGYTDLTWNTEGTIMTLTHGAWPEGARVTLAIGTGLTDAAGNALPQVFDTTFFTYSSTPVLLEITLPGGADAMIPNASPVFLFSNPMDLLSVYNNTVVTEAPPSRPCPSSGWAPSAATCRPWRSSSCNRWTP